MTILLRQKPLTQVVRQIVQRDNGAFFDAQDMSTMFQDAAGTIPVTAMEQPVGKILDKSGNNYHATQPITASRPTLSARHNMLTNTEDFAHAVWIKSNCSVTSGVTENPFGLSDVPVVVGGSSTLDNFIHQAIQPMRAGVKYTSFRYVKADSATFCTLGLHQHADVYFDLVSLTYAFFGVGFSSASIEDVGQGWRKITASWVFQSASSPQVYYAIASSLSSQSGVPVGSRLYTTRHSFGVALDEYQRVNTATDYDTVGFKKYLKLDGVDDYLNLPYMGLYDNGAASIVAARDALLQATDAYVISERSTSNVNPKYFQSRQSANTGNMDAYIVNDAAAVVVDSVESASDAVVRSAIDSGNNIKLFKNGALAANENYTRSGTLTLTNTTIGASVSTTTSNYANMKLYGLVITKSALSDSERRCVELLLAYNSGVQI